MSLFIPITKVDTAKRLVYGTISEEVPDKAGEILDYESSKPAFMEWSNQFHMATGGKSLGNVRAMHGAVAAGKLTDIAFNDEEKRIEGVAKIIDDDEWEKVLEGVYTGFSIGGGYARRWPDKESPSLMRYTPTLSEVSLVDNPAVPTATFQIIKGDGTIECRKFNTNSEGAMEKALSTSSVAEEANHSHITALLEQLAWLEKIMIEDNENDLLSHIYALQDFLHNEDDADSEPEDETDSFDDEDDTTAQAYAGELARMTRRATYKSDNMLNRRLVNMASVLDALKGRIEKLESQPVAAKGFIRTTAKSDDKVSMQEVLDKMTPAERARELMKIALSHPVGI